MRKFETAKITPRTVRTTPRGSERTRREAWRNYEIDQRHWKLSLAIMDTPPKGWADDLYSDDYQAPDGSPPWGNPRGHCERAPPKDRRQKFLTRVGPLVPRRGVMPRSVLINIKHRYVEVTKRGPVLPKSQAPILVPIPRTPSEVGAVIIPIKLWRSAGTERIIF
jgi:hypothetical protein